MSVNLRAYNLIEQAEELVSAAEYKKALLRYEICAEHEPNNLEVKNSMGFCFVNLSRYSDALQCFEEAIQKSGNKNPHYLTNLACCLVHLNRAEEALPYFQKAVKLDSENPIYMANLAGCEAKLGVRSAAANLRTAFLLAEERCMPKDSQAIQTIEKIARNHDIAVPRLTR